jgi:hypothetical protein
VPLPGAVRKIGSLGSGGLVSVDGTTYWLAQGAVVSFDLGYERLYASPLPVTAKPGVTLMVVRGKLGVAVGRNGNTHVWVLEGRRWKHRYDVQLHGRERLTSPHFAHGKYVLATSARFGEGSALYWHRLDDGDARRSLMLCSVVRLGPAVSNLRGLHRPDVRLRRDDGAAEWLLAGFGDDSAVADDSACRTWNRRFTMISKTRSSRSFKFSVTDISGVKHVIG